MLDNNVTAELFHVKPIRLSFYSKYLQSWNLFSHFYLFAGLFVYFNLECSGTALCNQIPPKLC